LAVIVYYHVNLNRYNQLIDVLLPLKCTLGWQWVVDAYTVSITQNRIYARLVKDVQSQPFSEVNVSIYRPKDMISTWENCWCEI